MGNQIKTFIMMLKMRSLMSASTASSPVFLGASPAAPQWAIRGPKKKKGGNTAVALPDSLDIVNIFKEGKDAPVYPSDMYPPFVMQLLEKQYTPDEIML